MILSAYNLALAEKDNLDLCSLCSSCTSALTEAARHLSEQERDRADVNQTLEKVGLKFEGKVKVRHFARILYEEVGLETLKKSFVKSLEGLRVASHYGCHYIKPSEIYSNFDQVEDPHTLDEIVALTGATVMDYQTRSDAAAGRFLQWMKRHPFLWQKKSLMI